MTTGATEPRGIWSLIFDGLIKTNAVLGGGGIAIIASILIGVYLPGHVVPLWLLVLVTFVLLGLILALLSALKASVENARALHEAKGGAVVEAAIVPFSPYENSKCVFIVRFTGAAALPIGSQVIISTAEAKHERPLGTGFVRLPQQDGKSVVTLDAVNADAGPFLAALLNQHQHDAAVVKIRIGPGYDLQNLSPRGLVGTLNVDAIVDFQSEADRLLDEATQAGRSGWGEDDK